MSAAVTLSDVISRHIDARLAEVRVAIPATVLTYDSLRQTVTVQIAVPERVVGASAAPDVPRTIPPLSNVPVMWPAGTAGTFSMTMPLAAGDGVMLVFADRSTDEVRSLGQTAPSHPADPRRFDLTDAYAIPTTLGVDAVGNGQLPSTAVDPVATVIQAPLVKIGSSSATDFVALASLVLGELQAIRDELQAHTHTYTGGGAGSGPLVSGGATGIGAAAGPVTATKTMAE